MSNMFVCESEGSVLFRRGAAARKVRNAWELLRDRPLSKREASWTVA